MSERSQSFTLTGGVGWGFFLCSTPPTSYIMDCWSAPLSEDVFSWYYFRKKGPGLCPLKIQHRWWWLTFRIYPIPLSILMMEAGFSSETLTSSYGVWYCRGPQSLTCCHLYHRQNPQQPQFKPEWFQSIIQLVMYTFHSWPSCSSSVDRTGHFVGAMDEDAEPW
jgi:hypothetical protein